MREVKVYAPEEFPVRMEVYSRVVGYLRPVNQWNDGKKEEFADRKLFDSAFAKIPALETELER